MSAVQRLGSDRGATLVIVATWLPVLVLFITFALDVGNWFEHKRHLQLQADAGALAAGGSFNACAADWLVGGTSGSTTLTNAARAYSGDPGSGGAYNSQVGGSNRGTVTIRINSKTYQTGGPGPDDTVAQPPCQALMVDVKATEARLPLFFGFVPNFLHMDVLPAANAHARVQIFQVSAATGGLPLAVPDINPKHVSVTFVDEAAGGTPLAGCANSCTFLLTGPTPANGLSTWSSNGPVSIPVPSGGGSIGMRVNVGGGAFSTCPNAGVICYDFGSNNGLVFIRGYLPTGGSATQPNSPIVRGAWPTTASCNGSSFFSLTGTSTCSLGIAATVDFGTGTVDPTKPKSQGGVKAQLSAVVNGTTVAMAYDATTKIWSTPQTAFPMAANAGPLQVSLNWGEQDGQVTVNGSLKTCTTNKNNPCTGTFSGVQRVFGATDDRSGPVKAIALSESGGAAGSPYALTPGTHNLTVQVGLKPSLSIARVGDPPALLRLASTSGSHTYALDCGGGNFRDQIVNGCATTYQINQADICPDPANPTPPDCVPVATGDKTGQLDQGMDQRFGTGSSCAPNNWASYPNLNPADRRIVPLIVTDFGAFNGSGGSPASDVPVRTFATFYITGWDGSNCSGNEPFPGPGTSTKGDIWGHFVKGIAGINTGGGGGTTCDVNALGECVAVLTK